MENIQPNEKRIAITGGSSGVGGAIAEVFLSDPSNKVAICARTPGKLDAMKQYHPQVIINQIDLNEEEQAKRFISETTRNFKGLDILILSAAVIDTDFIDMERATMRERIFQINVDANVSLIDHTHETLQESKGTIIFLTTRFSQEIAVPPDGIPEYLEKSPPSIANYVESKRKMQEYLQRFIQDEKNRGIFVFSVIPGSVNTTMTRSVIRNGDPILRESKIRDIANYQIFNPRVVGKVIEKMATLHKKFNPETKEYDRDIQKGEVVEVTSEAVLFEESRRSFERAVNRIIHVGDVMHRSLEHILNADDLVKHLFLRGWSPEIKASSLASMGHPGLQKIIERFYGEKLADLTIGQIVVGVDSIIRDFDFIGDSIAIARDELWARSCNNGQGTPGKIIQSIQNPL